MSASFAILTPILKLSLFNQFNNWSPVNIGRFAIRETLAIYSIFLAVTTGEIQAKLLTPIIYLYGLCLFMVIIDVV